MSYIYKPSKGKIPAAIIATIKRIGQPMWPGDLADQPELQGVPHELIKRRCTSLVKRGLLNYDPEAGYGLDPTAVKSFSRPTPSDPMSFIDDEPLDPEIAAAMNKK